MYGIFHKLYLSIHNGNGVRFSLELGPVSSEEEY